MKMKGKIVTILLVVGIVLATAPCLSADTITSNITEDSYLVHSLGGAAWDHFSYGASDTLAIGNREWSGNPLHKRMILSASTIVADLVAAGVTSSAMLDSATLNLGYNASEGSYQGDLFSATVHQITTGWSEGTNGGGGAATGDVDWDDASHSTTAWTTPGGDFGATLDTASWSTGTDGTLQNHGDLLQFTGTLVDAVKSWFDNGNSNNYGLLVMLEGTTPADRRTWFHSSESVLDAGAYVPTIEVAYTIPEPATMVLLGLGGLLIRKKKWIARRKRQ